MDFNKKISSLTVGDLKDLIQESVAEVIEDYLFSIIETLKEHDVFDDDEYYGDNGGE